MPTSQSTPVFVGGPSFQPLYSSARCAQFPETGVWASKESSPEAPWAQWTDVLMDFRTPDARTDLPEVLPEPVREWPSDAPGWALTGWCWAPETVPAEQPAVPTHDAGDTGDTAEVGGDTACEAVEHAEGVSPSYAMRPDSMSLVRFTAPDGFRFAVVTSNDNPGGKVQFAYGRMSFLFPTMRFVFAGVNDTSRKDKRKKFHGWVSPHEAAQASDGSGVVLSLADFPNASQTYSLPTLRAAMEDPAAWFGSTTWQERSFEGPFRTVGAERVLLGWATAGYASFDDAEAPTFAGMDAAEWATWRTAADDPSVAKGIEWSDEDCFEWFRAFGGGAKRREHALRLRGYGLDSAQASRWKLILGHDRPGETTRAALDAFDAAGWDVNGVLNVREAIQKAVLIDGPLGWGAKPYQGVALETVQDWVFVSAERAVRYVQAGVRVLEAHQFEDEGVDDATLDMMAALRPERAELPF